MPNPTESPILLPADLGYSMPAEWHPHAATWLAWPHNIEDWPGKFEPIPWIFAEIVRLIAQGEHVNIFIPPIQYRAGNQAAGATKSKRRVSSSETPVHQIRDILARSAVNLKNITLIPQRTDRIWTRDSGPIFLTSPVKALKSKIALADFKFNAWAKYDNSHFDDQIPSVVAQRLKIPTFTAYGLNNENEYQRFVLEGGSIDVNGAGCVLTTEECLLSKIQQRNPHFSRARIETTLAEFLGIQKVLWLNQGIFGDDTHGHIDDTARFTDATTILTCIEPNKSDPNHAPMKENLQRLKKMRDTDNKQFTIAELPLPTPVYFEKQRLPASYANFYICNTGVLVPVFNDPNDTRALKVIESCFPSRSIIPVYCRDLVWGLGTLHCMTQQQPKVLP